HEPAEDVTHTALPRLVAPGPGRDAVADHAAHARDLGDLLSVHHVAGGGAHHSQQRARLGRTRSGDGDVGVDVADRDGDAFREACGRSAYFSRVDSGVPSASVGKGLEAVKSMPMPITRSGSTPAASTASGTACLSTST